MSRTRIALLATVLLALGGCRFKSWESFSGAVEPNPTPSWGGNEYQSAGNAEATGGQKPQVHYTMGATNEQKSGFNTLSDQPAKGSGQNPGELPNVARPGYGQVNSPAAQETASSVGQPGVESGRGY